LAGYCGVVLSRYAAYPIPEKSAGRRSFKKSKRPNSSVYKFLLRHSLKAGAQRARTANHAGHMRWLCSGPLAAWFRAGDARRYAAADKPERKLQSQGIIFKEAPD
jgi:hypothetical protein